MTTLREAFAAVYAAGARDGRAQALEAFGSGKSMRQVRALSMPELDPAVLVDLPDLTADQPAPPA